ncbi:chromate transporter [Nostoc sp. NMS9]|uniref:chromate transporter n=1 Tax=Nostoc sp. NMS9 TaxID=2815393 RepID=UPI0025DB180E|nr:chromate transporter [Nostoc sp. NMS9]MBN3943198.1 chromate transporter [Nostoc sp. NMS9]
MTNSAPSRLGELANLFFKLGVIGFGGPVAHIAMIEDEVVKRRQWLTREHFLDLLGATNLIPGPIYPWPVLSTATFIGYVIAGIPGAIVATIGIFLPSFIFVAALNPLIPRLRASSWARAFLDAVNVSAVALMVVTTLQLGVGTLTLLQHPFVDFLGLAIAIVSAILAIHFRINAAWLVFGSAFIGWVALLLGYTR